MPHQSRGDAPDDNDVFGTPEAARRLQATHGAPRRPSVLPLILTNRE